MAKTNQQSAESNRQLIIDIARELIANQGVKGTSISDIARQAGISKGTLFYYYPSKNDLIFDVTDQHFEEVTKTLARVMTARKEDDPRELFRIGFTGIINETARGQMNLYLVQDAVTGNEELKLRFKEKYEEWRQRMLDLLQSIFPDEDKHTMELYSFILVAVLDGLIIQWQLEPNTVPVTEIAEKLAEVFIKG
ncbi:MAG: TetR/AcrR family transcriptional regulator [Methylocystaceae bacterium]